MLAISVSTQGIKGLRNAFSPFGTVGDVTVITDRDSGRSRGFGFVEIADDASAEAAIQALNGTAVDGRTLTVNQGEASHRQAKFERRPFLVSRHIHRR